MARSFQEVQSPQEVRKEEEAYLETVCRRIPARLDELAREGSAQRSAEFDRTDKPVEERRSYSNAFAAKQIAATTTQDRGREKKELQFLRDKPPYFGRMDVIFEDEETAETIYLGRGSLRHERGNGYYVYDHREPIGRLFALYNPLQKSVSYKGNGATIPVQFLQKRRYDIHERELQAVYNGVDQRIDIAFETVEVTENRTDEAATPSKPWFDPYLVRVLSGRRVGGKIGDIVPTIQAQQDELIRRADPVWVVQGPAGSGKTVCALQRAAQLLFDNRRKEGGLITRGDQVLLYSPTALFSGYVSEVLPGMGEENLAVRSWDADLRGLLQKQLRADAPTPPGSPVGTRKSWVLEKRQTRYELLLRGGNSAKRDETAQHKSSAAHAGELESFAASITEEIIKITGRNSVMARGYVRSRYGSAQSSSDIFLDADELSEKFRQFMRRESSPMGAIKALFAFVDNERNEYSQNADSVIVKRLVEEGVGLWRRRVEEECKPLSESLTGLYRRFWQKAVVPETIRADALAGLDGGELFCEDMVPLLFLDGFVNGFPDALEHVQHLIVDEGQDYSPLHYAYLKRLIPSSCAVSIVGDINQGIDAALSLGRWERLNAIYQQPFRGTLGISYRSAKEVTDFASAILPDEVSAQSVRASGVSPRLLCLEANTTTQTVNHAVIEEIKRCLQEGFASVCVLFKTREEARKQFRMLEKSEIGSMSRLIKEDDAAISTDGVLFAPIALVKGMEFDAVIIADANAETYADASLKRAFYMACTRPLHRLSLLAVGDPSPLLPNPASGLYETVAVETIAPPPKKRKTRNMTAEKQMNDLVAKTSETTPPLFSSLTPEYLRDILAELWAGKEKLPGAMRESLEKCLKTVNGFRSPLSAPFAQVEKMLNGVAAQAPWSVLNWWRATQQGKESAIRSFLQARGVPVMPSKQSITSGNAPYLLEQYIQWSHDFHAEHGETDVTYPETDDIRTRLMLYALAAPPAQTVPSDEPVPFATALTRFAESLRSFPATAEGWDTLPDFLQEMRNIWEQKNTERATIRQREREAERTEREHRFTSAAEVLQSKHSETVKQLEFDLPLILAHKHKACDAENAISKLEELPALLAEYERIADVRQFPLGERAQIRNQQAEQEAQIIAVRDAVMEIITAP